MKRYIIILKNLSVLFLSTILFIGCKKDWLDAKPDKAVVIPLTIRDYQAMLDNNSNGPKFNADQSMLGEIGAGDFFETDGVVNLAPAIERNLYIWKPNIYENVTEPSSNWHGLYNIIFYTNVILEGIEKIKPTTNAEQLEWNQVKGSASFFRAYQNYVAAQEYCKPYVKNSAHTDLGIPLRLTSDFNIPSTRSTVEATYSQILSDLKVALSILPISTPINTTYQLRPTQVATTAMLARVYLAMGNYDSAYTYADRTLQVYNTLMNFNLSPPLLPSGNFRIPRFNPEVLFHTACQAFAILGITRMQPDSILVQSYDVNDLRKDRYWLFSGGTYKFTGSYDGGLNLFTGIATDEIYLIRAECFARMGNTNGALNDLNALVSMRWRNTVTYPTITATDANDALRKVLVERRKELIFRGLRWTDLRRLNQDPQFAVTLTRSYNGATYTLAPNSPLYILPIPTNVIQMTGMEQNPR